MNDVFKEKSVDEDKVFANTRSNKTFYNYNKPESTRYGLETLRNLGPKIWSILPENAKNADSLRNFKSAIQNWKPIDCPC